MKHTALKGGYVGWLMADMKKKEADDVCEHVELSIRKKFKKEDLVQIYKKLSENMNWSKRVTGSQYVFPVERFNADGKAFPGIKAVTTNLTLK